MHCLRHKTLMGKQHVAKGGANRKGSGDGVRSEKSTATGDNCERVSIDGVNSKRTSAASANSKRAGADDVSPIMNSGGNSSSQCNANSSGVHSKGACGNPKKRGRGKMSRTQLKLPPRGQRVELIPKGDIQFRYANYDPNGLKYASQVGAILKRQYPGIIKAYNDEGDIVDKHPTMSWNDFFWKKNDSGVSYARQVKQECWRLFFVKPQLRREADQNLENYLVKRVTNMMHQARLDAVKLYYDKFKGEDCDDTRARTIELTEAQYLKAKLDWCDKGAWALLSHYWTTKKYKEKRKKAQESRMKSDDVAQNRGGSRNFAETQQYMDFTFGAERASTLNTYVVMKSGMKNMDKTGCSGPIPSQKAQRVLDGYKAKTQNENSQELDGKILYSIGRGLPHGRVPIGNGDVKKADVLAAAKSSSVRPTKSASYQCVIEENTKLKKINEINIEENSVNRELIMSIFTNLGQEPPATLLSHLANIDARRHEAMGSSHSGSDLDDDMGSNEDLGDSMHNDEDSDGDMHTNGDMGNSEDKRDTMHWDENLDVEVFT
uniref:Uncharacterized protein n=1 Tax=Oryza brachyantha TaxID=4533 RepID=J3MAG6_ORYBR